MLFFYFKIIIKNNNKNSVMKFKKKIIKIRIKTE